MEQRSDEWYKARLGKVTASSLDKVMASGAGRTRASYMAELLAERFSGQAAERFQSKAMEWGTECEPIAQMAYEMQSGNMVEKVGFINHPEIFGFGASPDGLVGDHGNYEMKCPETKKHLETLFSEKIDREYILQMHGQMLCAKRQWTDFVSFDPRLPEPANFWGKTVRLDESLAAEIITEVKRFLGELDAQCQQLIAKFPSLQKNYDEWLANAA